MWTIQDLNLRPSHYECAALTIWAKGPIARLERFELPSKVLETRMLPLHHKRVNKKENRRWFSGHLFLQLALLGWIPANSGYISRHSLSNCGYNHSLINFLGGPGRTRTYMLRRGRIYSPLRQPIAQPIQIWLLCYFANFGRLVSLLIIITQGVTHPSVTLLFLSPDVATTTRGTITLFAGYLGLEPRTYALTVRRSNQLS